MEAKVIRVINKMIENSHLISDVLVAPGSDEFYFVYDKKSKWSISMKNISPTDIMLYYYPDNVTVTQLVDQPLEYQNFMTYRASDFKSQEVDESFRDLYTTVKGKLYGIDKVFDEILGEDEPFT